VVKPATQKCEGISLLIIKGLLTASIFENFSFNSEPDPCVTKGSSGMVTINPNLTKLYTIKFGISRLMSNVIYSSLN
jgi:hypothetical protein